MTEQRRELHERLEMLEALLSRTNLAALSRTNLAALGLPRRGVDATFRELELVVLPRYSRAFVRVADYLGLVERSTFRDDRVRT